MRYTDGSADGVRVGVTLRRAYEAARIVAAYIASGPGDNGTWDTGETVEARMRFSAPVRIVVPEGRENRRVEVPVNVGRSTTPRLRHASGSGTDTLTFAYIVDDVANGATQAALAGMRLILNGLKVVDANGRDADVRFSPSPQIESVTLIPDASGDRAWTAGESVEARLAFSEAVTVEDGTPALGVTLAGEAGTLDYASGSPGRMRRLPNSSRAESPCAGRPAWKR